MLAIEVIGKDGSTITKTLEEGSRVSQVADLATETVLLNGERVTRDCELRDGDTVQVLTRSHKDGKDGQ